MGVLAVVLLAVAVMMWAFVLAVDWLHRKCHESGKDLIESDSYDAVVLNTYKPAGGMIPERGKIVVKAAAEISRKSGDCPIFCLSGVKVRGQSRSEGEIYADYLNGFVPIEKIVTSIAPDKDTRAYAKKAVAACLAMGKKRVAVVALWPHLYRVRKRWDEVPESRKLAVDFIGVSGQFRYLVWEFIMIILDDYLLRPGKLREKITDFFRARS